MDHPRILQQKSGLLKQPKPEDCSKTQKEANQAPDKVFVSKASVAVNYKKPDLDIIAQNCNDLNGEQKAKLLSVLKKHELLFQGKHGNWKGKPASIKVIDDATPI